MERSFYLDLAARYLRMPVAAHLLLHEQPDPEAVIHSGERLGQVVAATAQRYRTPLAVPLMDLTIEKALLLATLDIPADVIPTYHFAAPPTDAQIAQAHDRLAHQDAARLRATSEGVHYVAKHTDLVPVGMVIGPFSLMTKLLADPITAVYMAGRGRTAADSEPVALLERALELSLAAILCSVRRQLAAGARAMFGCEPAASTAYLSPRQLATGTDIFDRLVLAPNRRLKALLDEHGADLVFHCCGELTTQILRGFTTLDPAILSLGSSRTLWEDAHLVPRTTVLYGNLPSKQFYSDEDMPRAEVSRRASELLAQMRAIGHPFILGTECDVLSVPGSETQILSKIDALMEAPLP